MRMRNSKKFSSRKGMQGATIVEVMVSVLLLTFGVLALMAAQIRSVASVTEAENRSIISQAAEALAEGMQINSTLSKQNVNGQQMYVHSYGNYKLGQVQRLTLKAGAGQPEPQKNVSLSKEDLAKQYLDEFEYVLQSQVPNVSNISYIICQDKDGADAPTMNNAGVMDGRCASGRTTTIKVAWRMRGANGTENPESPVYTYTLQVAN
ncbi:type IV pilus modification protein PilV [Wielerella bovis]|uniref:type IV pilus modification protein PilV n=1 Tax=Wielerella bovis TaxID=2917790 RepID=UPI0020191A0C|nr:type IV pilus modification protein PilV [Wielerella bovis]ULJ65230.1 type IV pilus modification protein PilV [Wielerella bovis]ULJ67576.1 type IV pilus modification protein PilV [Wielerella bovis]